MHLFPSTFISKIILFSGIIFYFGLFSSEENTTKKGIDFYNGNYEEALQKAKTEEKLVFVYLYADWCGVCKSLKKNTLKDKKVGQFYNDEYVSLALNAEKGEGKKIAKSIGLRSYPTLLFLDGGNGRILNQVSGYKSPIQLINLGKVYTE
ncbi:thioredoxin family protein [Mesonia mobilis]|uniref:thioredoxin family protein n=1 Tax=Mesonia mobilis TaxID=369791 RepID=UPI0024BB5386|nr:thioredoxin family protein [Mesonia mobilis]